MSLKFANRICPNCKNPNYMVFLEDFSKAYKYKCMNCNGYFNDIDFEKEPLQPVLKSECMNSKVDMIDQEKVVKGLKEISDYFFDIYINDTDSYKCEKAREYSDVVIDAIVLLKKQEDKIRQLRLELRILNSQRN